MLPVATDALIRGRQVRVGGRVVAGVLVPAPRREAAAGDVQAQAMPPSEPLAGDLHVDGVLVDPAWLEERWPAPDIVAEARADEAFGDVDERSSGWTSVSRTTQSVSLADDAAYSFITTGPVTSRSWSSGGEV
jgi:hypothetical protein